jgi:hypothetical protein
MQEILVDPLPPLNLLTESILVKSTDLLLVLVLVAVPFIFPLPVVKLLA